MGIKGLEPSQSFKLTDFHVLIFSLAVLVVIEKRIYGLSLNPSIVFY